MPSLLRTLSLIDMSASRLQAVPLRVIAACPLNRQEQEGRYEGCSDQPQTFRMA